MSFENLHPIFAKRLKDLCDATGCGVTSGWRSSEKQSYLYDCYVNCNCNNCNPANRPGESNHEAKPWGTPQGLAADLYGDLASAHNSAAEFGIHFPIMSTEPWHCQPIEVPYSYYNGMPDGWDLDATHKVPIRIKPRKSVDDLRVSSQGLALIAEFEGFRTHVYLDSVGVETIGYGETRKDIINKYRNKGISQEEAFKLLSERVEEEYAAAVRNNVKVSLYQSEFDALSSLCYNLGPAGWSGLLDTLNAGNYEEAAKNFGKYVYAGGRILQGLVTRRDREAELFRSEWNTAVEIPRPIFQVYLEDELAVHDFRLRPGTDRGGMEDSGEPILPTYDWDWVLPNGLISNGIRYSSHIRIMKESPRPGPVRVLLLGNPVPGDGGKLELSVEGGQTTTIATKPATDGDVYGAVAIVSLDRVPLVCRYEERPGVA